MYEELLNNLEPIVRGILRVRKLRVDNFEDFLQEVRIRIFKYGLPKYAKEMTAVARHVVWAHKSYKSKKRKLTEHQLPDTMGLSQEDSNLKRVDLNDEIENIVDLMKSPEFTKDERFVFGLMRDGCKTMHEMGQKFNPTVSRQYIWQIQKDLKRKIRELKWTY
jgi:hypothetical protein